MKNNFSSLSDKDNLSEQIFILSTIAPIHALVEALSFDLVKNYCLIAPNIDPHSYQIKKGDADLFSKASFIFYNGLGLEHGSSLFLDFKKSGTSFALGDYLLKNSDTSDSILWSDGMPDPHIWLDIALWKEAVLPIGDCLAKLLPNKQSLIRKRAFEIIKRLEESDREIRRLILSIHPSKRYLVSEHLAFRYFVKAYLSSEEEQINGTWEDRYVAPQGFSPDAQLSFLQVQKVFDFIVKRNIRVAFPEVNVSPIALKLLLCMASKAGHSIQLSKGVLYSDCFPDFFKEKDPIGAYINVILHNARVIKIALDGS